MPAWVALSFPSARGDPVWMPQANGKKIWQPPASMPFSLGALGRLCFADCMEVIPSHIQEPWSIFGYSFLVPVLVLSRASRALSFLVFRALSRVFVAFAVLFVFSCSVLFLFFRTLSRVFLGARSWAIS